MIGIIVLWGLYWGPHNRDYVFGGSILGSQYVGRLPNTDPYADFAQVEAELGVGLANAGSGDDLVPRHVLGLAFGV